MRKKNKLWTSVALMLLVGAIMAGVGPVYASPTTLELEDRGTGKTGTVIDPVEYGLGEKFNMTVNILDVTNLGGWAVDVEWDPNVLVYTGPYGIPPTRTGERLWEGTWFSGAASAAGKSTTWTTVGPEETSNSTIYHMADAILPMSAATPPLTTTEGDLMYFELEVVGYTSGTWINITFYDLYDHTNTFMTNSTNDPPVNCYFVNTPPSPYGPTVDFSWPPGTYYENENVTFTATSTPGYHVSTGFLYVMNYTWDFGDGTGTVVDDVSATPGADSVVTHNFTTAATRTVTVTVKTADNPAGDPYETASKSKDILIWARVFSKVDVYTVKDWLGNTTMHRLRGDAIGLPGSAFAPGENVTLVSEALYEGLPVVDLNVGFQVNKPDGSLFASLSDVTNTTGHAQVSFRVPLAPLPPFGAYEVISTARMFEEDFNDTLKFYVGWIVEIESVTVDPDPVAKGAQATFNVTVTNYDPYDAYPVFLTVNAFDKLGQAIATDKYVFDIPAAGTGDPGTAGPSTTTSYLLYITIPGFAWPGTATVKANAYTDWPQLGGTAYCPEVPTTFSITT